MLDAITFGNDCTMDMRREVRAVRGSETFMVQTAK